MLGSCSDQKTDNKLKPHEKKSLRVKSPNKWKWRNNEHSCIVWWPKKGDKLRTRIVVWIHKTGKTEIIRVYWINSTFPSRHGSALRHQEVADCPEVVDSTDARTCPQKTADIDSLRYSPDDPHYGLGPAHTSRYFRVAWDWWLGHLPRSPGTCEGGDSWSWSLGDKSEAIPRVRHREWNYARILGIPTIIFR